MWPVALPAMARTVSHKQHQQLLAAVDMLCGCLCCFLHGPQTADRHVLPHLLLLGLVPGLQKWTGSLTAGPSAWPP